MAEPFDDKSFTFPRIHLLLIPPNCDYGDKNTRSSCANPNPRVADATNPPTPPSKSLERFQRSFRHLSQKLLLCDGRRNRIDLRNAPHAVSASKYPGRRSSKQQKTPATVLQSILHKEHQTEIVQRLQGDVQSMPGQQERYPWISLLLDPMTRGDHLKRLLTARESEEIVLGFVPCSQECFHVQLCWVAAPISSVCKFEEMARRLAADCKLTLVRVPHITRQDVCSDGSSMLSAWETCWSASVPSRERYVQDLRSQFDVVRDFRFKRAKESAEEMTECHQVEQFVDRKGLAFIRIEYSIIADAPMKTISTAPFTQNRETLSKCVVKIFANTHHMRTHMEKEKQGLAILIQKLISFTEAASEHVRTTISPDMFT